MNIIQVNTYDIGGGAEKVARDLSRVYRERGHISYLVVGSKYSDDPSVLEIPRLGELPPWWSHPIRAIRDMLGPLDSKIKIVKRLRGYLRLIADGVPAIEERIGRERFNFPGSHCLARLLPEEPEIIHLHNLHGGYFDLRFLAKLSQEFPLVMTLHDEWTMTGHCAYTMGCERWETGCGHCPDLTIYPAIRRDGTAWNWKRKRRIYKDSRFHLATPSQWLLDRARRSMLQFCEARVIPNGVDLAVFHPVEQAMARAQLNLPQQVFIILYVGKRAKTNPLKDYETIERAIYHLSSIAPEGKRVMLVTVGNEGENEELQIIGSLRARHVPFLRDAHEVSRYYQAADVFLHAARLDNFPTTVLEALACGKPVVATAVGGIPEQVSNGTTGFLVPPGDFQAMATCTDRLLRDKDLRDKMSHNAAKDARKRFDLNRQVDEYLAWYQEIIES